MGAGWLEQGEGTQGSFKAPGLMASHPPLLVPQLILGPGSGPEQRLMMRAEQVDD